MGPQKNCSYDKTSKKKWSNSCHRGSFNISQQIIDKGIQYKGCGAIDYGTKNDIYILWFYPRGTKKRIQKRLKNTSEFPPKAFIFYKDDINRNYLYYYNIILLYNIII